MSRPRILIVDDDEQMCFVATRSLESIARCDAVHDVAEATHALEHDTYDLVLVDVTLPGPVGHDAARPAAAAVAADRGAHAVGRNGPVGGARKRSSAARSDTS